MLTTTASTTDTKTNEKETQPTTSMDSRIPTNVKKLPAKHPLGRFQAAGKGPVSPTDKMMSPCTAKIQQNRQHMLSSAKPRSLTDQFAAVAKETK